MALTRYQIKQFLTIKKNTRTTAFQDAILSNDSDQFFEYVAHFGDKINYNVLVKKDIPIILCALEAGLSARGDKEKPFEIFNFIYNHPKTNRNILSKDGYNLLTVAAKFGNIEKFQLFEKDEIKEPANKDVINSALKNALFHNRHLNNPFYMVDYILMRPQYRMRNNIPQIMNELCKYYYNNNKPQNVKNIFFTLFEKGGLPLQCYGNSSFLLFHSIRKKDFELYKEITEMPFYQTLIHKTKFNCYNEHPFYEIIENEDVRFMELFIEQNGQGTLTDFPSGAFLQKIINRCNKKNDLTLFRRCVLEFGMNPMEGDVNFATINQSALHSVFNLPYKQNIMEYLNIIEKHPAFKINYKFGAYNMNFIQTLYKRYANAHDLADRHKQISQEIEWLEAKKYNVMSIKNISDLLVMAINGDEINYNNRISGFDFSEFNGKKTPNYLFFSLNDKHLEYLSSCSLRSEQAAKLINYFYHNIAEKVNLLDKNDKEQTILEYIDQVITNFRYPRVLSQIRETIYFEYIRQQKLALQQVIPAQKNKEVSRL